MNTQVILYVLKSWKYTTYITKKTTKQITQGQMTNYPHWGLLRLFGSPGPTRYFVCGTGCHSDIQHRMNMWYCIYRRISKHGNCLCGIQRAVGKACSFWTLDWNWFLTGGGCQFLISKIGNFGNSSKLIGWPKIWFRAGVSSLTGRPSE